MSVTWYLQCWLALLQQRENALRNRRGHCSLPACLLARSCTGGGCDGCHNAVVGAAGGQPHLHLVVQVPCSDAYQTDVSSVIQVICMFQSTLWQTTTTEQKRVCTIRDAAPACDCRAAASWPRARAPVTRSSMVDTSCMAPTTGGDMSRSLPLAVCFLLPVSLPARGCACGG